MLVALSFCIAFFKTVPLAFSFLDSTGVFDARLKAEKHIYGKYFRRDLSGVPNFDYNTLWLYRPIQNAAAKLPLIFQVAGTGWKSTVGAKSSTPAIEEYIQRGFAFASLGYRGIDLSFNYSFFTEDVEEELVHIDSNGLLSLDMQGEKISDYQIHSCLLELLPKMVYDALQGLLYLISKADQLSLDVHRIVFIGSSAGAALTNYLVFVYHKWQPLIFTPIGLILANPQFNLPVVCANDLVWNDFIQHMGALTPVSSILPYSWCNLALECPRVRLFGNLSSPALCSADSDMFEQANYCASPTVFSTTTLATLSRTLRWNTSWPEYGESLLHVWLTGGNMIEHQPRPFHIFVHLEGPRSCQGSLLHHPMYIQQYAEFADQLGINYTAIYTKCFGVNEASNFPNAHTNLMMLESGTCHRLVSTFDWEYLRDHILPNTKFFELQDGPFACSYSPNTKKFELQASHLPFACSLVGKDCPPRSNHGPRSFMRLWICLLICCFLVAVCACFAMFWCCWVSMGTFRDDEAEEQTEVANGKYEPLQFAEAGKP